MKKSKAIIVILVALSLFVLSPILQLTQGSMLLGKQSDLSAIGSFSPSTYHSSSSSELSHAFLPREPRLQDVKPISGFAPVGITAYGSTTNPIQTSNVEGNTTIDSMGIGLFSGTTINYTGSGGVEVIPYVGSYNASLQENAVLWLGNLGTYWTQNVVFITERGPGSYILQLINNIWNFSSDSSNMAQSVTNGTGQVSCYVLSGSTSCFYYKVDPQLFTLTPPFKVSLSMSLVNGTGVANILFLYSINDAAGRSYSGHYDLVQLYPHFTNAGRAPYFQVGGYSPVSFDLGAGTSITLPSDLELIFGGPGDGSSVYVNSITGSQELFYSNGTAYVPATDVYSIGSDTGEQASGIALTSNLTNPGLPQAILSSGPVSSQKLWPLPISIGVTGTNKFQDGSLDLRGQAFYSTNSSSGVIPASNLTIKEIPVNSTLLTSGSGQFDSQFRPNSTGKYSYSFYYPGSASFDPFNSTIQITVSSINISSAGGIDIIAAFNDTRVVIANTSVLYVPLISGTTVVVGVQNITDDSTNQLGLEFKGFGNTSETTVVLNGNFAQRITAQFAVLQGQTAPVTTTLEIALIIFAAVIALGVGLAIGYTSAQRKYTWKTQ